MAVVSESVGREGTPQFVGETAAMALELHSKLFPQEPVEGAEAPVEPLEAETDLPPVEAPAPDTPSAEDTFEQRYRSLQGKFNKLVEKVNLLETQTAQPAPVDPPATVPNRKDEIMALLNEKYDEELVANLVELQKLQAEEIADARVRPVETSVNKTVESQAEVAAEEFKEYVTQKAAGWEKIWQVATELKEGYEPSDDKIAEFLLSEDPSGLYRNYDLIHHFEQEWNADKFSKLCLQYQPAAPVRRQEPPSNIAPSRMRTNPSVPQSDGEKRMWTMAEFSQFQADVRAGRIDEATKDAMWHDVQTALAEGRIR